MNHIPYNIDDHGGALEFDTPDSFLGDTLIYCNRCAETTGEMHLIFRDEQDGYVCRHIVQPVKPEWTLVYCANPYMGEGN